MPIIPTPPIQGSPPPIKSAQLRDFTGGMNLAADDLQLPANQFADSLDVDPDVKGGFARRASFRSLGDSGLSTDVTQRVKMIAQLPDETSNGYLVMGSQDTAGTSDKLAVWASADISDGHARTALRTFTTPSQANYRWSWAIMNRISDADDPQMYIHRDYVTPTQTFQSDGTLHSELTDAYGNYHDRHVSSPVSTGGTNPRASILCFHSEYLFHADCYENSKRHKSRLRWSWNGYPGDYDEDDFIDIGEGQDNDQISALVSAQGRLFIFKRHSVWVLDGFSAETFAVTQIASGIGASNKACAAEFLDGVVFFDESQGVQKISPDNRSWRITPMWENIKPAITDGRLTNSRQAVMTTSGSVIAVSGMYWSGATKPNRTFIHDANVGDGWWMYSVGFSLLGHFSGSAGRKFIVGAGPFTDRNGETTTYQNYMCLQRVLSTDVDDRFDASNEKTYTGYMFTTWVDGGDPARKKRWRRFSLTFDAMTTSKSFTVSGYRNWSIDIPPVRTFTVTGLGTATAGIAGQQNNVRGGALGTAYAVALKIEGPNDVAWGVGAVTFRYVPKRIT